ncbi:hypothetical protein SAMN05216371_0171 [Streptomyces sp. TLI_053]|uniref:hypothetical protein n=1 Tax=Streptomyces sp. TLI_053 TaxID=1855352 RepID=UPI00087ABA34|nr:hypothetical protein [Streptomyces sp. TLI_053]SDS56480.1 hypothetical protein SAMN05216371_0171 [Streptomyces sp. TLI_053]
MGPTNDEEWTVSVGGGLLPPTTLAPAAALTEIWRTVRDFDLGPQQHAALRRLFGAGGTEAVEDCLDGDVFDFPVVLPGDRLVAVRVRRGDGLTGRHRNAARYEPVQLPAEGRDPGLWAVKDSATDDLVRDDGHVLRWGIRSSAESWIRREVSRGDYRQWNGRANAG